MGVDPGWRKLSGALAFTSMHGFETILIVFGAAVMLSLLAQRLRPPFPPFVALAGAGVAFLPFTPEIALDPALVLALFVAPVLVDASFDSSPRDLRMRPLLRLTGVRMRRPQDCGRSIRSDVRRLKQRMATGG